MRCLLSGGDSESVILKSCDQGVNIEFPASENEVVPEGSREPEDLVSSDFLVAAGEGDFEGVLARLVDHSELSARELGRRVVATQRECQLGNLFKSGGELNDLGDCSAYSTLKSWRF